MLAALAPYLTNSACLSNIRCQIATNICTLRHAPRSNLLNYLAIRSFIAPPLDTSDEIAAITETFIDITTSGGDCSSRP